MKCFILILNACAWGEPLAESLVGVPSSGCLCEEWLSLASLQWRLVQALVVRLFLGGVGARFGVFVLVVWRWLFEGAGVLVVLFWCVGGLPLIFQ